MYVDTNIPHTTKDTNMSTPIRFVRRVSRQPKANWKKILLTKKAETLISVAAHFGIVAKKKDEAATALVKVISQMK